MSEFTLKPFQFTAARQIAARYRVFANHNERPFRSRTVAEPFFQGLSALTGAGKTPILAHTITLIRGELAPGNEPIIIWMSMARSVVAQTLINFQPGGKYHELVDDFRILPMASVDAKAITDASSPLLILCTVGLFNRKDADESGLSIYSKAEDSAGSRSIWEWLQERRAKRADPKRPLVLVYDEGHKLSKQQTEILLELEPEAIILASATLKLPEAMQRVVREVVDWAKDNSDIQFAALGAIDKAKKPDPELILTTTVDNKEVVKAELVKKAIFLEGATANMEECIDDLFARLKKLEASARTHGLPSVPKAIYVCRTNIADTGDRDDPAKPFNQRQAPPIRIWRYLVEEKKVNPSRIAVYCELDFAKGQPKPVDFCLFSRGDDDFDQFHAGDYQHIIFNLSLQEGWDDPACYLAYVDKSMQSSLQVEQLIGRVLRQPESTHFEDAALNTAHFFLRVDKKETFSQCIDAVKQKLAQDDSPIEVESFYRTPGRKPEPIAARDGKLSKVALHHVFINSEDACDAIERIVEQVHEYSPNDPNTKGEAETAKELIEIEKADQKSIEPKWKKGGSGNFVRARWIIRSGVQEAYPHALTIADLSSRKFDVPVQTHSRAAVAFREAGQKIAQAYVEFSQLEYNEKSPFIIADAMVNPSTSKRFKNSIHPEYSGMNPGELEIAGAIDATGLTWFRNPAGGGFFIPLLTLGTTRKFYPDFIVWKKGLVYCIDPKGAHLLAEAAARKLLEIRSGQKLKLVVRLITKGKQSTIQDSKPTKDGWTVWKLRSGNLHPIYVQTAAEAVSKSLS